MQQRFMQPNGLQELGVCSGAFGKQAAPHMHTAIHLIADSGCLCQVRSLLLLPLPTCRYLEDFTPRLGQFRSTSTRGAISVHINSNEHTDSRLAQNWIDFDAGWLDDQWHHVAVTWNFEDGRVHLYLDGQQKTAFWKNSAGMLDDKPVREGGVDPTLAPRTTRAQTGSLVLGQVRAVLERAGGTAAILATTVKVGLCGNGTLLSWHKVLNVCGVVLVASTYAGPRLPRWLLQPRQRLRRQLGSPAHLEPCADCR
jgi:hypothetical protein